MDAFLGQRASGCKPTRFILLKSITIDLMVKCNEKVDSDRLNIHSEVHYKPEFSPWRY